MLFLKPDSIQVKRYERRRKREAVVFCCFLFFSGCKNFINLERIGFSTSPETDNTILAEETSSLSIHFNTAMDKLETQKVLSVAAPGGNVRGDLLWQGDTLFFIPLEPWLPGVRYTMNMEGTLYALDGREDRISHSTPFYSVSREGAPYGLGSIPADGASVGVNAETGAKIIIVFSQPMDRTSSADAFFLEGTSGRNITWKEDDTVMEICPAANLAPWTVYRWTLSVKARGKNGVPLGRELGGCFTTDADRLLPAVEAVFPLVRGGSSAGTWWIRTADDLETGLGSGQVVGIQFNKAMDESVLRNIRFDPPLAGRAEMWKDNTAVFIPDRDPEPDRTYTLFVSPESRDSGGLKMEREYRFSFKTDIPFLAVVSLDGGSGTYIPTQNGNYPVRIFDPEGTITLALVFSHIIKAEAQAAAVLSARLEAFFPGTLKPVSLRSARWWSGDTLILQWEGLEQNSSGGKNYYRLVLPGSRGGISDGKGSYLKEDTIFFLEGAER